MYEIDVVQYLLGEEYADRTNIRFSKTETAQNENGSGGHACELRDGVSHSWDRIYADTQDGLGNAFFVGGMGWLGMVENPFGGGRDLLQHHVIQ